MASFRHLIQTLRQGNELLTITRPVDARFELGALLQQAEARRKAILFEAVRGADFPVIGGLLTSPTRFGLGLGVADTSTYSDADHVGQVKDALANPLVAEQVASGPCKEVVAEGDTVDLGVLPVPTFFSGDSGPYLTAAVGIARNPDNGVINAGFYRVLMLDDQRVAVSASPTSDCFKFISAAAKEGKPLPMALVIGVEPALLMSAAAKVPSDVSELDVAGALQGEPLQVVQCETSDLPVPAAAEFVLEVSVDPAETLPNTMGEFGDLYGTQTAFVGKVNALTHRRDAIFHALMAGAGKEHNTIGMIVLYGMEPDLREQLFARYPEIAGVRVNFEPPKMGSRGDVYISVKRDARPIPARELLEFVFGLTCGQYPMSRIIRRVLLVDEDIDLQHTGQLQWAIAARASRREDYYFFEADNAPVRVGIDTRRAHEEAMRRLEIPGAEDIHLDDYLE